MAEAHINAYRAEAEAAVLRVAQAQGEADQAVAEYVARGGKEKDVRPVVKAAKAEAPAKEAKKADKSKSKAKAKKSEVKEVKSAGRQRDAKGHFVKVAE